MTTSAESFGNPLIDGHLRKKQPRTESLIYRMTRDEAKELLVKDLAMSAAIQYYAAVVAAGSSHPPKAETIMRTAQTFEEYYEDLYEGEAR